jgi:hypothetical protein
MYYTIITEIEREKGRDCDREKGIYLDLQRETDRKRQDRFSWKGREYCAGSLSAVTPELPYCPVPAIYPNTAQHRRNFSL